MAAEEKKQKTRIKIDKDSFDIEAQSLTGAELKQLPTPAIGAGRDLYLTVPGQDDRVIRDDEVVEIKNGMHFFTAPSTINPG